MSKIRLMGTRQLKPGEAPRMDQGSAQTPGRFSQNAQIAKEVIADLEALASDVTKRKLKIRNCTWSSRFHLHHRGVRQYRSGHLFVAGDAAHIHSPVGAQGMNTGIQDATNLGWKLAYVLKGWSSDALLDSYHDERHKVGQKILTTTDRLFSFITSRQLLWSFLRGWIMPSVFRIFGKSRRFRMRAFRFISQTAIHYDASAFVHDSCEKADRDYVKGPKNGARAPLFGPLLASTLSPHSPVDPRSLLIHFADRTHQSAQHREAIKVLAADYSEQVRFQALNPDQDRELYKLYGVNQTGITLVRPDGHIGYRACNDLPEPLARYLQVLMGAVRRDELPAVASPMTTALASSTFSPQT